MNSRSGAALSSGLVCEAGHARPRNEDAALALEFPGGGLYAVADGMGGHQGGDVAASLAIAVLERGFLERSNRGPLRVRLLRACSAAHQAVHARGTGQMGTTLVALAVEGGQAVVAQVGDSRAYLWRGGALRCLTRDHSWVAEQLRRGLLGAEEARAHRDRHLLAHALGVEPELRLDLLPLTLQRGDRLLLCSDGVSNALGDAQLAELLAQGDAPAAARALVEAANRHPEPDNLSAVVVDLRRLGRPRAAPPPALQHGAPRTVQEHLGLEGAGPQASALQSGVLLAALYAAIAALALAPQHELPLLFGIGLLLVGLLFSSRRYHEWALNRQFEGRMAQAQRRWQREEADPPA